MWRLLILFVLLPGVALAQSSSGGDGSSSSSSSGAAVQQPMMWTCSGGYSVGSDGEGHDIPECQQGYGAWLPEPVPFWEQQLDQSQMNNLFSAVLAFCALVWVSRKIGEVIEARWS